MLLLNERDKEIEILKKLQYEKNDEETSDVLFTYHTNFFYFIPRKMQKVLKETIPAGIRIQNFQLARMREIVLQVVSRKKILLKIMTVFGKKSGNRKIGFI